MQVIEVLGDGFDSDRVLAWMLFPKDPEMRRHYLERLNAERVYAGISDPLTPVTIPAGMLHALVNGPSGKEMADQSVEATKQGSVAGDLLSLIHEMHFDGSEEPSFGKAIERYKRFALTGRYGDGEALKRSEQTLRNYFTAFAPVAHLWAALRLNCGPVAFLGGGKGVFPADADLGRFLGVAKAFGEFASSFVPKRTSPPAPVIPAEQLVQLPAHVFSVSLVLV